MKKVSVEQFEKECPGGSAVQLIDVREKAEHKAERLEGFALLPLSRLSKDSMQGLDKAKTTYLLCRSGNRACQAGERLEKMGFSDIRVIEGGLRAWQSAGKTVIQGASGVWTLERQVRFAAGFLVLSGLLLAKTVHPGYIFLSVFVAAGLIFSAVTDTCGMAMVLARMPWNQK